MRKEFERVYDMEWYRRFFSLLLFNSVQIYKGATIFLVVSNLQLEDFCPWLSLCRQPSPLRRWLRVGEGFIHGRHDSLCRGDPRVSLCRCISFSTLREMPRTSPSLQPTAAFCNKKGKVSLIFLSTHAKTPSVLNHELGIFSNSCKTW